MVTNNVSRALRDSFEAVGGILAVYGLGDGERRFFWDQWMAICQGSLDEAGPSGGCDCRDSGWPEARRSGSGL